MKVLLSGFGPFSSYRVNTSEVMVKKLSLKTFPGKEVRSIILPVTFRDSFMLLQNEMDVFSPDVVLCFGLAAGRKSVSLEKVAINLIDCQIPDNAGEKLFNVPIIQGEQNALFSTLPLEELKTTVQSFPVEVSYSAGAFVCNYLMYRVLSVTKDTRTKAGFIHLPEHHESSDDLLRGLSELIEALS
jgi:pyroglutamyl-peptidase